MYTRQVSRDKAATRRRLLDATAELTYAGGVVATGVDAIAARAGVTKRTLYQHFRSKDQLVGASLMDRDAGAVASLRKAALRRAERDGTPPIVALFDVLHGLFDQPWWRGCAFQNASLELADPEHPAHAAMASQAARRRALVTEMLDASGRVDLANEVALVVEGAMAVSGTGGDTAPARRLIERLLRSPAASGAPDRAPAP
jgi:AcrR family transcriptional regulator